MLCVSGREGAKPSQIEGSNLGAVLLQVRGSQLLAKLGELSHAGAVNAAHMAGAHGRLDQLGLVVLTRLLKNGLKKK